MLLALALTIATSPYLLEMPSLPHLSFLPGRLFALHSARPVLAKPFHANFISTFSGDLFSATTVTARSRIAWNGSDNKIQWHKIFFLHYLHYSLIFKSIRVKQMREFRTLLLFTSLRFRAWPHLWHSSALISTYQREPILTSEGRCRKEKGN